MSIKAFTIKGIPLIQEGDDIGAIISTLTQLEEGDIVAIASTIVSKSEGRVFALENIVPGEEAKRIAGINDEDPRFVQVVLNESEEVLIETPFMLTRVAPGHICVNAGVDISNVQDGFVLLLPEDPDASARKIRDAFLDKTGKHVGVIITDTCGRPFRIGQTGVAIGCAGISPTRDWRGEKDLFGRTLRVANEAIVDELACLANLMIGEGRDATPVAVIRGLKYEKSNGGVRKVYRPEAEDVIRKALYRMQRRT